MRVLDGSHTAKHAGYAVAEPYSGVVSRGRPVPAHIADTKTAVLLDLLHHETDFVHMGRKHDLLRLRASLSFLNYYQITDRIRYHIVRIGCGFLLNQFSHFFFIAGDSLGLGQPFQ